MAKRQINQQQQRRILQQQQAELSIDNPHANKQEGLVIAHHGKLVEVEDSQQETHHCSMRQSLGSLVVGDEVIWQADGIGKVIVAIKPRKTSLSRPNRMGQVKTVAANIDLMVIVGAVQPEMSEVLLDEYLVAAELLGIKPLILFNKIDLLNEVQLQEFNKRLSIYREIGIDVLFLSQFQPNALQELIAKLSGKTAVFVGQSGVGKSSLIQALVPKEVLRISANNLHEHGRHTTSTSRLYHLAGGGNLIDSPGVREFGLWNITSDELLLGFKEFAPYYPQCQFRNCIHDHEPGCALRAAAEAGKVALQRWQNFKKLRKQLEQHD